MKYRKMVWVLFLILIPLTASAQLKEDSQREPSTFIEKALVQKGKIIIKEYYSVGTVRRMGSMLFDAVVVYEPSQENQKAKGLRIMVTDSPIQGKEGKRSVSYLDLDEIASLSTTLTNLTDIANKIDMLKKWAKTSDETYTEVVFSTRDEFRIGFYQKGIKHMMFIKSGNYSPVVCFFELNDIEDIKEILDNALTILKDH